MLYDQLIFSAIVSLIVALVTIKVNDYLSISKKNRNNTFILYMKLMEIRQKYEFLSWPNFESARTRNSLEHEVYLMRYEISDLLRNINIDLKRDILRALFLERLTNREREYEIASAITKLSERLNPDHRRIMQEIASENLKHVGLMENSGNDNKASDLV